jgi:hypothetical protein
MIYLQSSPTHEGMYSLHLDPLVRSRGEATDTRLAFSLELLSQAEQRVTVAEQQSFTPKLMGTTLLSSLC